MLSLLFLTRLTSWINLIIVGIVFCVLYCSEVVDLGFVEGWWFDFGLMWKEFAFIFKDKWTLLSRTKIIGRLIFIPLRIPSLRRLALRRPLPWLRCWLPIMSTIGKLKTRQNDLYLLFLSSPSYYGLGKPWWRLNLFSLNNHFGYTYRFHHIRSHLFLELFFELSSELRISSDCTVCFGYLTIFKWYLMDLSG